MNRDILLSQYLDINRMDIENEERAEQIALLCDKAEALHDEDLLLFLQMRVASLRGEDSECINMCEEILDGMPEGLFHAETLRYYGNCLARIGRLTEAISKYDDLLSRFGKSTEPITFKPKAPLPNLLQESILYIPSANTPQCLTTLTSMPNLA